MALDDGIRGCPTYEQVRQPSMEGFDRTLYTGRWYEHAFHDYTQFADVRGQVSIHPSLQEMPCPSLCLSLLPAQRLEDRASFARRRMT